MWSSRPFTDPPPFISGPRTALVSWDSFTWGREIWFTSLTLDVPTRKSTGKGAMFAHSGFWEDSGQNPRLSGPRQPRAAVAASRSFPAPARRHGRRTHRGTAARRSG